ncbi:MAG TPA: ribose-phosphate diphosphokinase [Burkholderiaceae bacterium]|nr:ribose-phosphate diphosphokinase [Burkholderiaceae bacterium]
MLRLFTLNATREFGSRIAFALDREASPHEEREFEDGEHKARPLIPVHDDDVYVVQSLHGDAQAATAERFVRLLFFAATVRDHGAARVTAVIPYLAYARKDRRTQPFDPVNSRYVAQLIEAAGIDRVMALEVHNAAAFDNAFRIPALHVSSAPVLAAAAVRLAGAAPVVVVSPDPGGVKRAQLFRETLEPLLGRACGAAFLEKRRAQGVVSGSLLAGDVRDATVVLVDDLISTGNTLVRAARTCLAQGAHNVIACAAHGLFATGADAAMLDPALSHIVITDSVAPARLSAEARAKLQIESAAPAFAAAIKAWHEG